MPANEATPTETSPPDASPTAPRALPLAMAASKAAAEKPCAFDAERTAGADKPDAPAPDTAGGKL